MAWASVSWPLLCRLTGDDTEKINAVSGAHSRTRELFGYLLSSRYRRAGTLVVIRTIALLRGGGLFGTSCTGSTFRLIKRPREKGVEGGGDAKTKTIAAADLDRRRFFLFAATTASTQVRVH